MKKSYLSLGEGNWKEHQEMGIPLLKWLHLSLQAKIKTCSWERVPLPPFLNRSFQYPTLWKTFQYCRPKHWMGFKSLLIVTIRLEAVCENWATWRRRQPEEAGILQLAFFPVLSFERFYPMLSWKDCSIHSGFSGQGWDSKFLSCCLLDLEEFQLLVE